MADIAWTCPFSQEVCSAKNKKTTDKYGRNKRCPLDIDNNCAIMVIARKLKEDKK